MAGSTRSRVRRTQAERSAAMRTRLLDATVECLVTYGYAGTTTQRVAELAGVTRGAQVHHFRSKEDLVVAAIEHLAEQRTQAAMREIGPRAGQPRSGVDRCWTTSGSPIRGRYSLPHWNFGSPPAPTRCWRSRSNASSRSSTARLIAAIAQLMPEHPRRRSCATSSTPRWTRCGDPGVELRRPRPAARRRRWDRVCATARVAARCSARSPVD